VGDVISRIEHRIKGKFSLLPFPRLRQGRENGRNADEHVGAEKGKIVQGFFDGLVCGNRKNPAGEKLQSPVEHQVSRPESSRPEAVGHHVLRPEMKMIETAFLSTYTFFKLLRGVTDVGGRARGSSCRKDIMSLKGRGKHFLRKVHALASKFFLFQGRKKSVLFEGGYFSRALARR
jgi:hypothetical protein